VQEIIRGIPVERDPQDAIQASDQLPGSIAQATIGAGSTITREAPNYSR